MKGLRVMLLLCLSENVSASTLKVGEAISKSTVQGEIASLRSQRRDTISILEQTLLLSLLLLTPFTSFAGDAELLFEAGNRAYLDGDWGEARAKWKQVEDLGYVGGVLYYNLGNAYFKTGELGEAILYWEKAAKLMGEDGDIAANLKIARAQIDDKLDEQVRLPVWDWFDRLRDRFSAGFLASMGVALSLSTFGAMGLKRWVFRSGTGNRQLRPVMIVLTLLLVGDLTMVGLKARDETTGRMGVFIVPEAEVLSAPALGSGKLLFTLHEGTKVRVIRMLEGWMEVSAGKEKQGWVKAESLGLI